MFSIIDLVIDLKKILHCDLNNFFASVEEVNNPELKNVPMAVCGDPSKRHGIVLAKNNLAKKFGIYTPENLISAKKKCPNLVLVEPHYDEYKKYSKLVNEVYLKYTDKVEPFSIDESFLDVTESEALFGSAEEIAYKIKEEIKSKYGLTISVGVSFNKALAKLGSDMKKPDAITVLDYKTYKSKIFPLPVSSLMFAGKTICEELKKMRIEKVGDLALYDRNILVQKFGKIAGELHDTANGVGNDVVKLYYDKYVPKSISKGMTLQEDTNDLDILIPICNNLCSEITRKLRYQKLKTNCVCVNLKDNNFISFSKQKQISITDSYDIILRNAKEILDSMIINKNLIRTITISVTNLKEIEEEQIDLFNFKSNEKNNIALQTLNNLKDKNIKIGFADNIEKSTLI